MVSSRKNWPVLLVPVLLAALFAAGCATIPGETPPDGIWSDLGEPSEGLVAVLIGNHWGYADEAGELVVAPQFSQALPFSNGRAAVRLTTRWGFIDRQGTYVVRPMYESAGSYAEGLAPVKTKKGWGYIDAGGHMAIPPEYDEAGPFSEDSAAVRTGSRWGYIAKDGRVLIEFNFKEAGRFSDGKAPVATLSDDNEWGYIDHDGRFVIPPTFDEARSFSEGRAAVQVDGRWGFIDGSGTLVVNPQFDDAGDFTRLWEPMDTRAPARKDGLWGLLSEDGSFAVPPRWAALGNFHDGQARAVSEDDRVALIDAAANEAEIRGSLRHAAVPPTRAVAAAGSDTVLVRIQVVDYLGGKAVKGYKIAATLGTYGWADIPNPPESDGSGNVVLLMERDRWEQTRTVFGKKDGWFSADLEVPDHKVLSHVLKVLSLDARLPRIDEVLCTQDKVSTNVLIQQAEFEFKKPGAVTFDFTTWAGALKIHKYFLQQGTKRIESDSPRFDVEVGRSFSVDDVISAGIIIDYRDMAIAMPTLIKIRKNPELEKPVEYPPTPPATMMGDIPFIAGTSGVLQLPGLQFGIVYGNDIVTLYYGLNPEAEKEKSPGWEGPFKSLMNEVANGSPNLNKIWEYYTGKNPIPNPGGKGTFKAAAGAMGYVELSYGPKGLEVVGGRLVIFGKFGYEFTAQTMVTVIPVYASFGLGGDLAVKFALDGPPKSYKDFFQDVTIVVAPYVDCEGGVGVKGLLSIGLALHGAIQMNFLVSRQDFNGKMTLDFFLRARALFIFTWEKKLAGMQYVVGRASGEGAPPAVLPGPDDIAGKLKMEDKSYVTAGSQWLGDAPPPQAAVGGDPLTLQLLKTNILPGSEPLLYPYSGGEALFWIDNAGGRRGADMTALMFSIRGKNGTWSEPAIVSDTKRGDYEFSVIEHRGVLYAAWQNAAVKFDKDEVDKTEVFKNSQILVAAYDPKKNEFGPPKHIYGPYAEYYYGRPWLASDGETMALVFVSNSKGDYFLKQGTTSFSYTRMIGDEWRYEIKELYRTELPVIGYSAMVSDGIPYIAINEDQDPGKGMDNRQLFLVHYEGVYGQGGHAVKNHLTSRGQFGNPTIVRWRGEDALFYYEGDVTTGLGNICYLKSVFTWGGPRQVFEKPFAMSEDFSLVTGSRDRIGVLFVDEGVNLHSDPAMIVYDPPRDAWSFPVHIAPEKPDPQQRAEAVRGVWNGERVDVAYRSLPASAEGGQNDPPTTTLVLASTLVAPDLAVTPEAVYRYYGPQKGGELVTIHVQVVNRGLDTAKGISLDIVEYNMTSMTSGYWRMFKDLRLRPGESTILPIEYRLPKSSSSPYKLFFEAHSLDGRELNTGNNSAPILFAEPDLGLGEITMTRTGFDQTFRVPIENRSPVRVRGVTLTLFNELQKGDVIERKSFEYIEPYTTAVAELTVHLGNLRWPVDTKRLLFEVESSDVMKAGAHSEPFVLINPYSYPAFSLAVFEARGDGGGYVWVSAAASNNHPVERSGDLVIELLDRRGTREGEPWTERVVVQPGHAGIVSHMFKVNENPSSYTVRVTTKNVPKTMPGAPETGGLVNVGGDPVPVEAPVAAESR